MSKYRKNIAQRVLERSYMHTAVLERSAERAAFKAISSIEDRHPEENFHYYANAVSFDAASKSLRNATEQNRGKFEYYFEEFGTLDEPVSEYIKVLSWDGRSWPWCDHLQVEELSSSVNIHFMKHVKREGDWPQSDRSEYQDGMKRAIKHIVDLISAVSNDKGNSVRLLKDYPSKMKEAEALAIELKEHDNNLLRDKMSRLVIRNKVRQQYFMEKNNGVLELVRILPPTEEALKRPRYCTFPSADILTIKDGITNEPKLGIDLSINSTAYFPRYPDDIHDGAISKERFLKELKKFKRILEQQ